MSKNYRIRSSPICLRLRTTSYSKFYFVRRRKLSS
eukprot:UN17272